MKISMAKERRRRRGFYVLRFNAVGNCSDDVYIISNSWFKLFSSTLAVFPNLKLWTDLINVGSNIVRILSTVPKI
jgi:hypothetical protein